MQKDPYLILGLKDDATQQQVEDAYRALRKEYEEKCFAEGEEGARAARKLTELDQAYAAYDKADYTAEGWAEITAAYEQGRQGIASATSIADAQAAQQAAVSAMAAVAQKPADPGTKPDTIPATGDPAAIVALMGLGGSAVLAAGVIARKRG